MVAMEVDDVPCLGVSISMMEGVVTVLSEVVGVLSGSVGVQWVQFFLSQIILVSSNLKLGSIFV